MDGCLPPHVAEVTASVQQELVSLCASLALNTQQQSLVSTAFVSVLQELCSADPASVRFYAVPELLHHFHAQLEPLKSSPPVVSDVAIARLCDEVAAHLQAAGVLIAACAARRDPPSSLSRSVLKGIHCPSPPPPLASFMPLQLAVVAAAAARAPPIGTITS